MSAHPSQVLSDIAGLLDGTEWDAETASNIVNVLREAGYQIREPEEIPDPCEVCGTRGWLLVRNDEHGLRVERCDHCATLTDVQAWDAAEPFLTNLLMQFDEGSIITLQEA